MYSERSLGGTCQYPDRELNISFTVRWTEQQDCFLLQETFSRYDANGEVPYNALYRVAIVCDMHGLWLAVGSCTDVAWPSSDGANVGTSAVAGRAAEPKWRQNGVQNMLFTWKKNLRA
jgi:hypothetical protein